MSSRERLLDRAHRSSLRLRGGAGEELRSTRVGLGRSQAFVGESCDMDPSQVSRIERGVLASVTVDQLTRVATVLGLNLSIKLYPGGEPLRDQAQVNLIERFRKQVGPPLVCRAEVPVPMPGDQRAWDLQILGAPELVGLEAESRMRDSQATLRKITLKARDSGINQVILLLAATHANRAAVAAAGAAFHDMFPVSSRAALRALREGRDPGGWAIILL